MAAITEPQEQPRRLSPVVELAVLGTAMVVALGSWWLIARGAGGTTLLTPPLVALLLVANLLPGMGLLVLLGRRIAMRRAARSPIGGHGRLHVRLVALFSAIAAVPTLLVVIFASLLFQYGVEFWFSDRARAMLEDASVIARSHYREELDRVGREATAMSGDLAKYLSVYPIESPAFVNGLAQQTYRRELSEAIILHRTPNGQLIALALVDPYDRDLQRVVTPALLARVAQPGAAALVESMEAPGALTRIDFGKDNFLYVTRVFDARTTMLLRRSQAIVDDYHALISRSRTVQVQFNAALLLISLLIVGVAVWVALVVADRLVRPVGELVEAARRVASGDLSVRVRQPKARDEIGTLTGAFNAMTSQLEAQTGALVTANDQLDSRRALIEAVMSGVSAGVVSIDRERRVRLINDSARTLLGAGEGSEPDQPLAALSPELDRLLDSDTREAVVQIVVRGETRTLAVKIAEADAGPILTFDDITQQLLDQRRAAWADVARRIAHEIKNPLTPIQLAAERLQRRYGAQVAAEDPIFARLTETIVRQVGDLRRMVDEFSSFARMPKPVFREEALLDIARQVMFLHEVAHGNIRFRLDCADPPQLVCDRRQIAQALTNVVKNAVEAIEVKEENSSGDVTMTITGGGEAPVVVSVSDTGIGLPLERDRIVEPYMTTRQRGTGLGLAIVKRIAEEHMGSISFADRPGGGTVVTLSFDTAALARIGCGEGEGPCADEDSRPAMLTRISNG
ncbi:ATP-binding protein [Sphingomonas sp.]|uniref:sensor histidine kinase NtrY-like n=1 Tax=Sphingomonas sp. TaxID=28214 RepID=UPI0025D19901|nr:ATP-binding protein [Sphingomonas sp.]